MAKLRKRNNVRLHTNFMLWEFESPDTGEVMVDGPAFEGLKWTRIEVGLPFYITSGYRTKAHNEALPGAHANSGHLYGTAFDVVIATPNPWEVIRIAKRHGLNIAYFSTKTGHFHFERRQHASENTRRDKAGHKEKSGKS